MQTTSITNRSAWSVSEIAQATGVSIGFVRKQIHAGALSARKLGRRVVVLDEDLRAWLNTRVTEG